MEQTFAIIIGLSIAILIFFALRELWCWYWKLNKIVENQERQTKVLLAIGTVLERIEQQGITAQPTEQEEKEIV